MSDGPPTNVVEAARALVAAPGPFGQYWQQSRRPLASLLFTLPLLALYEGGVLLLGTSAVRNGAEAWLRRLLDWFGFGGYFLLPVLTVGVLLAWHHVTRQPWRVPSIVLYGMLLESAMLGFVLIVIAHLQGRLMAESPSPSTLVSLWSSARELLGRLIGFFGAGFYEEVLFRLLLLPAVAGLVGLAGGSLGTRWTLAIVLTSLAFSAAHYLGSHGETFVWFTFAFRFLAGGFFALLFVVRGFGIAAGTHALYDIFVGLF